MLNFLSDFTNKVKSLDKYLRVSPYFTIVIEVVILSTKHVSRRDSPFNEYRRKDLTLGKI